MLLSPLGAKMGSLWIEGAASVVYRAGGSAKLSGLQSVLRRVMQLE